MSAREGTCIEHSVDPERGIVCECGCFRQWRLGDAKAQCDPCVSGECEHAKAGVDFEQTRLGL